MKLSTRIFALAFLNLALLAGVFIAFAHYQFHLNFGSLFVAPAEDRVRDVARSVTSDLASTAASARTALMGRYAATYGVDFYLFDNNGPEEIGGKAVELPPAVKREITAGRPPVRDDPPPPPPRREDDRFGPPPPRRGPPPPRRPRPDDVTVAGATYQVTQLSEGGLYWALTRVPVIDPANGDVARGTLVMAAPSFFGTPLFFDYKPWLIALAATIALFSLCWLPFIRGLTRSISRLTANTVRIAEGDFENHLPENRRDEIGQLSISINRMADRLAGFVSGQKRFLGDIAHELSAPIARIQFALGILEQQASDGQREAVEDLREEITHMSGLVEELLSFSRAGLTKGSAALSPVEIEPLARQAAAREAGSGREIVIEIPQPVSAIAAPNLLLRAMSNLVRNAMRYAGEAGPVVISAVREGEAVLVRVSDSGPGLPPEELDRVFAPFYRPDASRARETGGAGLGLAIVKSCVEASGGTVECRNREPHGLEVEIRLTAA
ncbi:MAG TPA: HAMP domain-containing sensor histidine kinase [Bryobacteraceae bacterium]|nr:HAMP domain-containing sensor histidine kinase [Bryobacteraceae bacterium]